MYRRSCREEASRVIGLVRPFDTEKVQAYKQGGQVSCTGAASLFVHHGTRRMSATPDHTPTAEGWAFWALASLGRPCRVYHNPTPYPRTTAALVRVGTRRHTTRSTGHFPLPSHRRSEFGAGRGPSKAFKWTSGSRFLGSGPDE